MNPRYEIRIAEGGFMVWDRIACHAIAQGLKLAAAQALLRDCHHKETAP